MSGLIKKCPYGEKVLIGWDLDNPSHFKDCGDVHRTMLLQCGKCHDDHMNDPVDEEASKKRMELIIHYIKYGM